MVAPDETGTDIEAMWRSIDKPSHKFLHYFAIYEHLFAGFRGKEFTFVEFGVQGGGSLQMWRAYFGPQARIIGVDLNPQAAIDSPDFEVFVGDQGDPEFLDTLFDQIGRVDVVLDDGGHQSFQQILTVERALSHADGPILVAVEDTTTSFDRPSALFHRNHSFQRFAQAAADLLTQRSLGPAGQPSPLDALWSVEFYNGIVAFRADPQRVRLDRRPAEVNQELSVKPDNFRYEGADAAEVVWPHPLKLRRVTVHGRPKWWSQAKELPSKWRAGG